MGKEVECKLLAPSEAVLDAIARDFSGASVSRTARSETDYFDLGAYARENWMFRARRGEDGRVVYTCKTPGEGYERGEWECEANSPAQAAKQLAAMGAPEALAKIAEFPVLCGAAFTRTAIELVREGSRIELALDRGALTAPGAQARVCEVELELKSGPIQPMLALRGELCARYGLVEGHQSKYARARALARGKEEQDAIR